MLSRLALAFAVLSSSLFAASIDFSRYHTQEEINQYLRDLARDNPALVHFYVLGESDEGREISYITLTKGSETALPGIFFNGTHHGNEWSSTESILGLIQFLLQHKDEPQASAFLTRYVFYFQPLVNPDGHFHRTREEIHGADPNRDYEYPGASAGSQLKTQIIPLVKKLADSHKFRAAAAYHSGIEEIIWPWCYTGKGTADKDKFHTIAKKTAEAMHYDRYMQSYYDYQTSGEFIDYLYMTQKTVALTFEVSSDLTPNESQLESVVQRSVDGAFAFVQAVMDDDLGRLKLVRAPELSLFESRNPLWVLLGMRLE